jgi:hypothetical protein
MPTSVIAHPTWEQIERDTRASGVDLRAYLADGSVEDEDFESTFCFQRARVRALEQVQLSASLSAWNSKELSACLDVLEASTQCVFMGALRDSYG